MVWFGLVWYGLDWFGLAWFGLVLYGMVWYGKVWYNGLVWLSYVFKLFLVLFQTDGRLARRAGGWILTKIRPTKFQTKFSLPIGTEFGNTRKDLIPTVNFLQ